MSDVSGSVPVDSVESTMTLGILEGMWMTVLAVLLVAVSDSLLSVSGASVDLPCSLSEDETGAAAAADTSGGGGGAAAEDELSASSQAFSGSEGVK